MFIDVAPFEFDSAGEIPSLVESLNLITFRTLAFSRSNVQMKTMERAFPVAYMYFTLL